MITVLIPTRDRSTSLKRVLDVYCDVQAPRGGWQMIVVDNASTDDTQAVLEGYRDRLPLRVVVEPKSGKNRALNTGLAKIEGDLIVFSDDDSLPRSDWLRQLRSAADRHQHYDLFAGRIAPFWPGGEQPAWIKRYGVNVGVAYAVTEHREGPCPTDAVWGPNMAVRRRVFDAGFRFNPTIGPGSEASYAMGGEVEFNQRLHRAGYRAYFCEEAVIYHTIRPEQLRERWLFNRAYHHGLGVARYHPDQRELRMTWKLAGLPLALATRLGVYSLASAVLWPLPRSRRRFRVLYRTAWLWGLASYQHQQSRNRSTTGKTFKPIRRSAATSHERAAANEIVVKD